MARDTARELAVGRFDGAVASAHSKPTTLAAIDLDDFAAINDDHGREAGDAVLAAFLKSLATNLPSNAVFTRRGGDEFAVLFPGDPPEQALVLLDEIRSHFASLRPAPGVEGVDVSIGVAGLPEHASSADELVRAASEALHRAKRQGGGRVAIYVDERMVLKSNYYPRGQLANLGKLSERTGRTEASLLREALDDMLTKYAAEL